MDIAYAATCNQAGVSPHPRLLSDFAAFAQRFTLAGSCGREADTAILRLGGGSQEPPIHDEDIVTLCLAVRSLSRGVGSWPAVFLDLTGEPVTCSGAKTLAAVLQVDCGLRSIILRRTHVSEEGVAALGAVLGGCSLVELDLGECTIGDSGMRRFARGMQTHGAPASLTTLLLDGNPIGDVGAVELISLLEGPTRPPALTALSVRPCRPQVLSMEVEAALEVLCNLFRVELREVPCSGLRSGRGANQGVSTQADSLANLPFAPCVYTSPAPVLASRFAEPCPAQSQLVTSRLPCSPGLVRPREVVTQQASRAPPPAKTPALPLPAHEQALALPTPAGTPTGRSNSGHLAAWMAGTERELRELKWLLGASIARLDGQHIQLMDEMALLRGEMDLWEKAGPGRQTVPSSPHDADLRALEDRFDVLDQLVGREQSACAQMWRLVESTAAGTAAGSNLAHAGPGFQRRTFAIEQPMLPEAMRSNGS